MSKTPIFDRSYPVDLSGGMALSGTDGTIDLTPTSGSDCTINLATTGNFKVNTTQFVVDTSTGMVGIGTAAPAAFVHVVGETEQARFGYDANNYWTGTIGSTGGLALAGTGTGGSITITPTTGQKATIDAATDITGAIVASSSVAIGTNVTLAKEVAHTVSVTRSTTAETAGAALSVASGSATSGATDTNGGTLTLSGGTSTGTGTSSVVISTATAGSTGTSDNSPTAKITVAGNAITLASPITASSSLDVGTNVTMAREVAHTVSVSRSTTAATAGAALTIASGSGTSGGTNLNGGTLTLSGGTSTGSGTSSIVLQTAAAGSSGTADRSPAAVLTITGSQMGFYGHAVAAQPAVNTSALTSITSTAPDTPDYAIQDLTNSSGYGFATKDEGNTVLSVIANLQTRVSELETKLKAIGLMATA